MRRGRPAGRSGKVPASLSPEPRLPPEPSPGVRVQGDPGSSDAPPPPAAVASLPGTAACAPLEVPGPAASRPANTPCGRGLSPARAGCAATRCSWRTRRLCPSLPGRVTPRAVRSASRAVPGVCAQRRGLCLHWAQRRRPDKDRRYSSLPNMGIYFSLQNYSVGIS